MNKSLIKVKSKLNLDTSDYSPKLKHNSEYKTKEVIKNVHTTGTMNLKYRKPMDKMRKSTDSLDESKVKKRDVSIESLNLDNSNDAKRRQHSTSMVSLHIKSPYINNTSKSPLAKHKYKQLTAAA